MCFYYECYSISRRWKRTSPWPVEPAGFASGAGTPFVAKHAVLIMSRNQYRNCKHFYLTDEACKQSDSASVQSSISMIRIILVKARNRFQQPLTASSRQTAFSKLGLVRRHVSCWNGGVWEHDGRKICISSQLQSLDSLGIWPKTSGWVENGNSNSLGDVGHFKSKFYWAGLPYHAWAWQMCLSHLWHDSVTTQILVLDDFDLL